MFRQQGRWALDRTLKKAIMNRIFASVLLCSLLLVVLAFTSACGGHSNQIGTCLACPGAQAVYATTNSGQILTLPFPLGTRLGTATSTAGPANSTGILVSGGTSMSLTPGTVRSGRTGLITRNLS